MKTKSVIQKCAAGLLTLAAAITITTESTAQQAPVAAPAGSRGYLLVTSFDNESVLRYDAVTGAFVDAFVPHHSGGLYQPYAVLVGPFDHNVYVSSGTFTGPGQPKAVLRYDGTTGAFIDTFADSGQLTSPRGIIFGPDGNLYVCDGDGNADGTVVRYNGATGAFLGQFFPKGSGGLNHPQGLVFAPRGKNSNKLDLYVSSAYTDSVLRYDGTTGVFLGAFVVGGSSGLDHPVGLTFGPDGNLYVASNGLRFHKPAVLRFQGPSGRTPGAFIDTFVPAGSGGLATCLGLVFGPDGNGDGYQDLYVTSRDWNGGFFARQGTSTVKRYDGITGDYIDTFVTADSGGLKDPFLLTFTETDPTTLAYTGE